MKIMESIVYVISQVISFGGREIVQGGGEILQKVLPKVSAKFCGNIRSSKFHQNHHTICEAPLESFSLSPFNIFSQFLDRNGQTDTGII